MKALFSLFFLLSIGFTANSQVICYFYDAAGNRRTKVTGPCDTPSGIIAPPSNNNGTAAVLDEFSTERSGPVGSKQPIFSEGVIVPNPVSATFEIRLGAEPKAGSHFELYDASGRKVMEKPAQGATASFDLSDEIAGTFYLFLTFKGEASGQWKVIKL